MDSVRRLGTADFLFVPTLVSLLRNRHMKARARDVLASYGEPVVAALAYFLADPLEDEWVRRHVPSTLALIPSQASVDALIGQINDPDGFLRYKVVGALLRLRRANAALRFPGAVVEGRIIHEARQVFRYLSLQHHLTTAGLLADDALLGAALRQKGRRGQNRIFQLLGLIYPPDDIGAAEWTLAHGDARTRASAIEYLDNLLTGPVRKMVLPLVEDLPLDERVRRGTALIGSRRRDVEDTLLQLMNDDDQVIAACAIDLVRQRQHWSLAPDIEHILAHRDARDWFVFEAASWALAEHRVHAERRRRLWLEPLPAVVLASQVHDLPLFASLSVEELFRLAGASRQIRHEPGTILLAARTVPDTLHVLLDGEVVQTGGAAPQTVAAPAVFGFSEALLSRPMRHVVRTSDTAVTLAMTAEELRTQLAYNPELVRGLFATMTPRRGETARSQIHPTGAGRELAQLGSDGVTPIAKVLALGHVPVFAHLTAEEAMELARITHTVTMTDGQTLFRAGDRPATWLLLSGEIRLEATETLPATTASGGDAVGSFSALAGPRVGREATVTRSGVALRVCRDDLFELLGDRPELLRQIFAGMMTLGANQTGAPETTPASHVPAQLDSSPLVP
jgi:CRP-like cAMP-binding protein